MPFYRIAGAAALLVSAIIAARLLNAKMSRSERRTDGFIGLLRYIKNQIDCYSMPVSEIFLRCGEEILADCGYTSDKRPKDFEEFLTPIEIEDAGVCAAVREFAEGFGKSYRDEQIKACDFALSALLERKKVLSAEFPKKKRVNTTLCISAALALIILML